MAWYLAAVFIFQFWTLFLDKVTVRIKTLPCITFFFSFCFYFLLIPICKLVTTEKSQKRKNLNFENFRFFIFPLKWRSESIILKCIVTWLTLKIRNILKFSSWKIFSVGLYKNFQESPVIPPFINSWYLFNYSFIIWNLKTIL